MIFKINGGLIEKVERDNSFKELEIEKLIVPEHGTMNDLNEFIFNEELMFLGRQRCVRKESKSETSNNRLDLLAMDRQGNGVIIELKRNDGRLGMETQALLYLSTIAPKTGVDFLNFAVGRKLTENELNAIRKFVNCPIEDVNANSRIILMAQRFDPAIFSLGTWLSQSDCSFKAIRYFVAKIKSEQFIQFSTEFEIHPKDKFGLGSLKRKEHSIDRTKPSIFWHNIGIAKQDWWDHLIQSKTITASYENENEPDCPGQIKMKQYTADDTVFAFATGFGVVGVGKITKNPGYKYTDHMIQKYKDTHFHTQSIEWNTVLPLENAVPVSFLKELGLNHPTQTKQEIRMNSESTKILIDELKRIKNKKIAA